MLARSLGKTRKELLESISASELKQWQMLYQMEPWGERRRDINTAQLAQLLVQLLASKESSSNVTMETFILDWWGEAKRRQAKDVWGRFKILAGKINQGFEDGKRTGDEGGRSGPAGSEPEITGNQG